jgi:hypothetical protein
MLAEALRLSALEAVAQVADEEADREVFLNMTRVQEEVERSHAAT